MAYRLRKMEQSDLDMLFARMEDDFPQNERAPFGSIERIQKARERNHFTGGTEKTIC